MADHETREDIVQLTIAAYGSGPDAALMRELERIVDDSGGLLDVTAELTSGGRWTELYPPSLTSEEFADAWLGNLLPGVELNDIAFAQAIVVGHLDAGGDPAVLVRAAQRFLSDPEVPAEFADIAAAFLARGGTAMTELAVGETRVDLAQLAVAAYAAAPGASLMAELEGIVDGGGSMLDAARALTSGGRWADMYPPSLTPDEFADEWLESLLPGVDLDGIAFARSLVAARAEAGDVAGLVLTAQEFLSAPVAPVEFVDFARHFRARGDAAVEHSVVRGLDGTQAELRAALPAAPPAAPPAEAGDGVVGGGGAGGGGTGGGTGGGGAGQTPASGDQDDDDQTMDTDDGPNVDTYSGDAVTGGGGGQTPPGGSVQTPGDGGSGGGSGRGGSSQTPSGGTGQTPGGGDSTDGGTGGGSSGGGTGGGGSSQTPSGGTGQTPGGGDSTDGGTGGGFSGGGTGGGGSSQTPSGGTGQTPGGGDSTGGGTGGGSSGGGGTGGGGTSGGSGGGNGQTLAAPSSRDSTDDQGRVALTEFDEDGDGTYERAEAYTWNAVGRIRTDFYDDWDDGLGVSDLATLDKDRSAHFMQDYDGDGTEDDGKTETFEGDGNAVRVEYDYDSDDDVDIVYRYAWTDGEIVALDAGGSTRGVKLDGEIAGVTGMLTVDATAFGDSVRNAEIAGGSKDEGSLGIGQAFNLGDGADTFTIRSTAIAYDQFDDEGIQTHSAPRLKIDAGDGGDTVIAPVDVWGAIAAAGGKGDDTFEIIDGNASDSSYAKDGHFIHFDGGPGDDTLLVDGDAGGGTLRPTIRIAGIENIHLTLDDTGANGGLAMRLLVASGFSDRARVTSDSAATLTAEDLEITFALGPNAASGAVYVDNIWFGASGAARPRINVAGGPGDDTLTGGPGPTSFIFDTGSSGTAGGNDTVMSYNAGEGDNIRIVKHYAGTLYGESVVVETDGADTLITYTLFPGLTEHTVRVVGVATGVAVMVLDGALGQSEVAYTA